MSYGNPKPLPNFLQTLGNMGVGGIYPNDDLLLEGLASHLLRYTPHSRPHQLSMKIAPFSVPTKNPIRCYQWFRGKEKGSLHYRSASNFKIIISLSGDFALSIFLTLLPPAPRDFFQQTTSPVVTQPCVFSLALLSFPRLCLLSPISISI